MHDDQTVIHRKRSDSRVWRARPRDGHADEWARRAEERAKRDFGASAREPSVKS